MESPRERIAEALRRERTRTGLSLTELSRRAGVAKSTVSQLEAAVGNPSVETLWALGNALGVPFSRLVDTQSPTITVLRAGEGATIPSERGGFLGTLLSSCPPNARRDIYVITLEPHAVRAADAHIPGTTEHLVVADGNLRTGPVGAEIELGPGDYAAFPGDVPHVYEARDHPVTAVLVMEHI